MEPIEFVLKNLAASGPVALILGFLCWKLWDQNQALMKKIDDQHERMLEIALRVQKAVETLAGYEADE